jgi:hypothetical protein
MTSCPNSSGIIWRLFHLSPIQRKTLFFGVCVPIRLLIAYVTYHYPYPIMFPLIFIFATATVVKLGIDGIGNGTQYGTQWWSKWFQLLIALFIILGSRSHVVQLLLISVVGGILQAVTNGFC